MSKPIAHLVLAVSLLCFCGACAEQKGKKKDDKKADKANKNDDKKADEKAKK